MGQTISFAMCARGPAARVREIVSLVRPVVDEVVVAVDTRGDQETLAACADLADSLLRFELEPPPCRLIGWILRQCSADWILRLDDDEVPGAALLEALPSLVARRELTHAVLPRRWVYGGSDRWIASRPWAPDFQVRLVRNVPSLWTTTGRMHDGVQVAGAGRFAEEPIYHADLVLTSQEQRRRKAALYESLRPGHTTEGVPVNAVYLPDGEPGLETRPVPPADIEIIDALLGAGEETAPPRPMPLLPVVPLAEIDRYTSARPVRPEGCDARVAFVEPPSPAVPGVQRDELVRVRNTGTEPWTAAAEDASAVRLGYRWLDGAGEPLEGPRTAFPATVEPGEEVLVPVAVVMPAVPGEFTLEVDVVHEGVRWFGRAARAAVRVGGPLEPVAQPVARAAGESHRASFQRPCDASRPSPPSATPRSRSSPSARSSSSS